MDAAAGEPGHRCFGFGDGFAAAEMAENRGAQGPCDRQPQGKREPQQVLAGLHCGRSTDRAEEEEGPAQLAVREVGKGPGGVRKIGLHRGREGTQTSGRA